MTDDAKEWNRKPSPMKTWPNFKLHFSRAHHELRESMETTKSADFPANLIQEETAQTINNLENATMADRETMANLTAMITNLTTQLAETNAKLGEALQSTANLQQEVSTL